ncbi:hypothetical protein FSP39_022231 [Pinctada imbricata]|uniref:Methyltransferase FkbM domain-containing protein n=1 Tax=Pinctada imbricata TaxID=66713 RepID=A0AA89C426_PINIB|nr:hypothetical protein FSP39_022231 [Pinctada imbricata]
MMKSVGCRLNWLQTALLCVTVLLLLLISWRYHFSSGPRSSTIQRDNGNSNSNRFSLDRGSQSDNVQYARKDSILERRMPDRTMGAKSLENIPVVDSPVRAIISKCDPSKETMNSNTEPQVFMYNESSWIYDKNICSDVEGLIQDKLHFGKVTFHSLVGDMPIYIHDPASDGISKAVLRTHNFEPHVFKTLYPLLKLDPEVSLIDIGANIGVNSLQAAKYGRNAIALEATTESTQHICASATAGNVLNKLTIIHNAISNDHTPVKIIHATGGGFGGAFMDDNSDLHKLKVAWDGNVFNFNKATILRTATLDDILDLPHACAFRKSLIKMDVEGSEHKAFQGAVKFFEKVDVQGVLMEYRWHVTRPTKHVILDFFKKFNFDPYDFKSGTLRKLEAQTMKNHDVLWLPQYRSYLDGVKIW